MFWTILLAIATGMRAFTGLAVVCWAAYLGYLPVEGTWAAWAGKLGFVILFTLLALGEYVGDVLPKTPSRTDLFPMLSRLGLGVLVGVILATALEQPKAGGVILGALGALIGTYGGHWARMTGARLVKRDLPVGVTESLLAIAFAAVALWRIHTEIMWVADPANMIVR